MFWTADNAMLRNMYEVKFSVGSENVEITLERPKRKSFKFKGDQKGTL